MHLPYFPRTIMVNTNFTLRSKASPEGALYSYDPMIHAGSLKSSRLTLPQSKRGINSSSVTG